VTVYLPKGGKSLWYDFWWRGERHRANTHVTTNVQARQVESKKREKLREQAAGLATIDAEESPPIADFAEIYYAHAAKRLGRPERVEDLLRVVLRFWGARPDGTDARNPIIEGEPYHDLRLLDPIIEPDWLTQFETWMDRRTAAVHRKGEGARAISGQTRNQYRSVMSELYKHAMQPQYRKKTGITMNPFAGLYRDRTGGREVALEPDDVRKLLEHASYHLRLAVAIGALAPKLRLANILALEWDRHFDRRLQFITVADHKTRRYTQRPLVVPISDQLREILEDARRRTPGPFVVAYRGEPVSEVRGAMRGAAERAGLTYGRFVDDGLTFHTLRHTAATIMLDLDIATGKRRNVMGHQTSSTTEKYEHLRPGKERAPLEQLSAALPIKDLVTVAWKRASTKRVGKTVGTTTRTDRQSSESLAKAGNGAKRLPSAKTKIKPEKRARSR
jgi:integrase